MHTKYKLRQKAHIDNQEREEVKYTKANKK